VERVSREKKLGEEGRTRDTGVEVVFKGEAAKKEMCWV
jgi:hypothetical protein